MEPESCDQVNIGKPVSDTGFPFHAKPSEAPGYIIHDEPQCKQSISEGAESVIQKKTALTFLSRLDENASFFTFQTFDDNAERKNRSLAKIFHGSLEEHFSELRSLQKRGAGVFVTVNETDGAGRTNNNIKRVRALFVDLDGTPLESVASAPIEPHMMIESSPGRYHVYWFVEGCPLEHFSLMQQALAEQFGGDLKVKDLARVMRLPGFLHQKSEPHRTDILDDKAFPPVSFSEFEKKFCIKMAQHAIEKSHDPILSLLQSKGLVKKEDSYPGCYSITCPWNEAHSIVDDFGTKYYLAGYNGYTTPGFQCFHSHCQGKTIKDLVQHFGLTGSSSISALSEWEEPIPLSDGIPSVLSFDEALLPDATHDWILDIADRMQIPPDFSAAASMVVTGSLIGRRCGIHPKEKDDWLVVPNLWGAIVGRPAMMKSPAIAEVLKPLHRIVAKAQLEHTEAMKDYEFKKLVQEAQKLALKDSLRIKAKTQTAGLLESHAQEHQQTFDFIEAPFERRYITEDGTVEKIGELLNQNSNGILVHRDELSGWLHSLEKYGREGDRAFYLEGWNGMGHFTVDRVGRGTLHIPALCLSIFGGIQPGPLSSYVYQAVAGGNGDDGLIQRFQMTVWPDTPRTWKDVDRLPDSKAKNRAGRAFEMLSQISLPVCDGVGIAAIHFDTQAQEVFREWLCSLEQKLRSGVLSTFMESHLAKYRSLMPKIALILYLIDTVDKGGSISLVPEVYALRAAAWCDYLESHAGRLYSAAQDPTIESAAELLKHMKRGDVCNSFSARDIYRNQWSKLTTSEVTQESIKVLMDYGWIHQEKNSTSKSLTYTLHPSLMRRSV